MQNNHTKEVPPTLSPKGVLRLLLLIVDEVDPSQRLNQASLKELQIPQYKHANKLLSYLALCTTTGTLTDDVLECRHDPARLAPRLRDKKRMHGDNQGYALREVLFWGEHNAEWPRTHVGNRGCMSPWGLALPAFRLSAIPFLHASQVHRLRCPFGRFANSDAIVQVRTDFAASPCAAGNSLETRLHQPRGRGSFVVLSSSRPSPRGGLITRRRPW